MSDWSLYLVRCGDGSLYCGVAIDVARRFAEHQGQGARCARYLRGRVPLALVYQAPVGDRGAALRTEIAVKRLTRREKEALIAGRRQLPGV